MHIKQVRILGDIIFKGQITQLTRFLLLENFPGGGFVYLA